MSERVVLAYSGGLDTSVAIGWIAEETGAEVVAVAIDCGQGGEDLDAVRRRALDCGAVEAVVADAREEFATEYCLPAIRANALYMDRYRFCGLSRSDSVQSRAPNGLGRTGFRRALNDKQFPTPRSRRSRSAHRQAPGRRCPVPRRHAGRPRLHGRGNNQGALRTSPSSANSPATSAVSTSAGANSSTTACGSPRSRTRSRASSPRPTAT